MEVFIGTSGWMYSWNEGASLAWYVDHSKLSAIELNASFYRFPFPSQVKGWSKTGKNLRWSIKVSRRITHLYKFNENAYIVWESFSKLFDPLKEKIDFFLFQIPPSMTPRDVRKIEQFIHHTNLREKFALEVRNLQWFANEFLEWAENMGITWVSVDAPELPRKIVNLNGNVYLRMHGRTVWYAYSYSKEELEEVAVSILERKPERVFVFFNNNHAMLKNARDLAEIFDRITPKSL